MSAVVTVVATIVVGGQARLAGGNSLSPAFSCFLPLACLLGVGLGEKTAAANAKTNAGNKWQRLQVALCAGQHTHTHTMPASQLACL